MGDRATFEALRREGRRVRRGPVTVVFTATAPEAGIRVAYGTPRRIGTAVTRNRVRRRLRSAVRELAAEGTLRRPGAYLVTVTADAVGLRYDELRARLGEAVGALAPERP
ncbi:MAG: ribonuclease P protein component [Acidimicrobiia bacterium]